MFTWLKSFLGGLNLNISFIAILAIMIGLVIIPNISAIAEKFGLETRATLVGKAALEKKNKELALKANADMAKVNDILNKTSDNKVDTINIVTEKTEANNSKSETIINKRKEKTNNLKKVPKPEPSKIDPEIKLAMELSGETYEKVQASEINALVMLEAYCEYNKDENCVPLTKIL